jgi:NAD-dependent dihydropyrimidine dehydrogenase PreA subunit
MNIKKQKMIKYGIGIGILSLVTVESYRHQVLGGGEAPSIHALCPYGALESLNSLFTTGTMVSKIFSGTFILLAASILLAVLFRRSFCGIICPFGTLQDMFGGLGRLIFKRRFKMPEKIDRPLRYLKYVVLAFTLFMAWKTASLWIAPYDPWTAYGHLGAGSELFSEYTIGFILLVIVLAGSMLYDRFFCKYFCPMGAFLGIFSKLSPFKIKRDEDKCIGCKKCTNSCPVNIKVHELKEVKSSECLGCAECVINCPVKNTLEFKQSRKISVKPSVYILATLVVFLGIILGTKFMGIYQDTPQKLGSGEVKTVEQVDESIKGYMTLKEVSEITGVSLKDIYKEAGFTEKEVPETTKCKDIGKLLNKDFEVTQIREIIKNLKAGK